MFYNKILQYYWIKITIIISQFLCLGSLNAALLGPLLRNLARLQSRHQPRLQSHLRHDWGMVHFQVPLQDSYNYEIKLHFCWQDPLPYFPGYQPRATLRPTVPRVQPNFLSWGLSQHYCSLNQVSRESLLLQSNKIDAYIMYSNQRYNSPLLYLYSRGRNYTKVWF